MPVRIAESEVVSRIVEDVDLDESDFPYVDMSVPLPKNRRVKQVFASHPSQRLFPLSGGLAGVVTDIRAPRVSSSRTPSTRRVTP